jgi:hypothetical protein
MEASQSGIHLSWVAGLYLLFAFLHHLYIERNLARGSPMVSFPSPLSVALGIYVWLYTRFFSLAIVALVCTGYEPWLLKLSDCRAK